MSKTAHELTRKELKGPDRFQQAAGQVAGWVASNQKQIAAGVVAAVGVVALGVGVTAWLGHREARAGAELSKVVSNIEGEISSVPVPGVNRPFFKSEDDRQRAVAAAAAEVRSLFPSSEAATTAALASGDAHLRLAEWDKALADYQAFLASAKKDDSLRFAALEGTARAYEGKGDLPRASQAWERVGTEAPFYGDRAEIERARLLAKMGRPADARKMLGGFDESFKDSMLKPEAHDLLAKLGEK